MNRIAVIILSCFTMLATSQVRAQDEPPMGSTLGMSEFSLSLGYANISVGGPFEHEGAFRFEPSVTFAPIEQLPQVRFGLDVGVSLVLDNSTRTIISGDHGLIFAGSSDVPVWFIEPALRLSYRQTFGNEHEFFIEPGIAGGFAFGQVDLTDDTGHDYDKSDTTFFGRVFLRAGARVQGGLAGIEASYLSGGKMDFGGDASGDLTEWYIGIFGTLCF